jgi:hypothetical protein
MMFVVDFHLIGCPLESSVLSAWLCMQCTVKVGMLDSGVTPDYDKISASLEGEKDRIYL